MNQIERIALPPVKVRKAQGKRSVAHRDRTKYTRKGKNRWGI